MKYANPDFKPFLRWPGGKRWLVRRLMPLIEQFRSGSYFEPFLGGGAMFFAMAYHQSILTDINEDLINAYSVVKSSPNRLLRTLSEMPVNKSYYYDVRASMPKRKLAKAAKFIYLNRLAFSGMYRVNRAGEFNVPFGGDRNLDLLWTDQLILKASKALRHAKIYPADFEEVIDLAKKGDIVYCDPTYTVAHNDNGFQRYNENIFSWQDQQRLANACFRAASRGACVIISNAAHESISELYAPYKPIVVERHSCVSRVVSGRMQIREFVFICHNSKRKTLALIELMNRKDMVSAH